MNNTILTIAIGALRGTDTADADMSQANDRVRAALGQAGIHTASLLDAARGLDSARGMADSVLMRPNRALRRGLARAPLVRDAWREVVADLAVIRAVATLTGEALAALSYVAIDRCSGRGGRHGAWAYGGRYLSADDALASGWSGVCLCGCDMRPGKEG